MTNDRALFDQSNLLPSAPAGVDLVIGDMVYLDSAGLYQKAQSTVWANSTAPTFKNAIGVIVSDALAGTSVSPCIRAEIRGYSGLVIGSPVYLSTTAGASSQTKPYQAQVIQVVGFAKAADVVAFDVTNNFEAKFNISGRDTEVYRGAASGAINAGQLVGITSVGAVKLADATAASALMAVGVALATVADTAAVSIYRNSKVVTTGKTAGTEIYLSKTAGGVADSAPATATGDLDQKVGTTVGAIEYHIDPAQTVAVHA